MADNTINVKIREAYDTEANWAQKNPKLLQGQIAISSDKHGMYKVGDGTKTWSQLSYASHPASDVYAWAKAQTKPSYSASEITGSVTGVKGNAESSYRTGNVNITPANIGAVNITSGFGQSLSSYASSDDNAISGTVVRYSYGQATGKPTGTDHAIFQMAYSDIWKTQLAQDWRTNKAYIRNCNNGTWGNWAEIYSTASKPTATDVGLGNVDNTQDLNKPISTATQAALDGKSPLAGSTSLTTVANQLTFGDSKFQIITSSVAGGTNKAVGWYRLFKLGAYSSGTIYNHGGYNTGWPTNAVYAITTSHLIGSITQLAGRLKSIFNQIRIIRTSGGEYYLDAYQSCDYQSGGSMSAQFFTFVGTCNTLVEALNPTSVIDDSTTPIATCEAKDFANGFLPLSGGTMTGTLTAKPNVYTDSYTGALNMGNSNIYGVNSIYTADASENASEGIHFYRDATHVDTLWMNGGDLLFVPNRALGTSTTKANSQKVGRFTANPTDGKVVVTDGTTGGMNASTVTTTELGYVSGVTSSIQTQLNAKAPLASPALTGTPTAPTAATGTNTTQIATTAFVKTAVDNIINGAPEAYDTLVEISNYISSHNSEYEALLAITNDKEDKITGGATTITSSNLTANRALVSDSSGKVAVSAVTSTELGYLDGVTSAIQNQLNGKQASITGGATTITSSNLTANRALISNSSGKVAVSDVTSTELGYLDGVTSAIQTQLNGKQASLGYTPVDKAGDTMTGNLVVPKTRIANTYYGVSFGRTTSTPKETLFHTGIKWMSGSHMPVIHITGYAYGLQSPVEFKIGFYIYAGSIGYCGAVNMGQWNPEIYLYKHTVSNVDYVSVAFVGQCYFLQLSADVQDEMGKFGNINLSDSLWSWEFLTTTGNVPATDNGVTCIKVPYKADILNPSKVNGHTVASDIPANAKFTDTTYTFDTGDANGQIKVTPTGGTAQNVSVKGLAALAYKDSLSKSDIGLGNVDNKSSATIRSEITSSNITSALGYTPVNKAGDTMSDCLTIQKDSGDTYGVFTRTDTDTTLCVGVGTGGVNHGIYSSKLNKWIAYADASNIYLNGNALTATTADDTIRARLFTSRQTTPDLAASGKTGIQHFLATSSMSPSGGTDVRPGNKDGHIIHMSWDNTGGWDSQIYMQNGNTPKLLMRGQQGGTWGSWTKIYTANDKPSKSDVGLGNVDNKSSATIRGEITSQNVTTALGYTPVNKAGDTMTGSLTATSFQTGDNDNNFFQTRRFRGQGDANTYYHAIDFGYAHHDQVDFYEYGGVFNFHKHTGQAIDVGDTIIGTINSDGWNGGAVLTGTPTAPTATAGTNTTQIATTEFVKTAVDNFAASGAIDKATTLETPRTIDGVAFNGSANVTHFGVCSTNAETAEKAVACNNFSLDTGQVITVKFTTTNTAQTDIMLNVNSTGAKAVKYRNNVAPSSSLFVAGRTYQFVYDGEAYQLVGDIDSNMDSKVMQSLSTEDVDHPVLFSYTNKNDTTADINNGSYRSNSIYANPQTGTLTATTLKGYLDGNAKSATVSSFLNPTDSNTTYGSSTERGTITDGVVVFGESFRNTVDFVNEDESMISDSGDITMWMKQEADDDVRLNMSIDGDYYAHKDQPIAKLSEVVTLNGDQTVLGYKTFPGATFTNDTRWETGNYGFMIRNDGESTWFLLTAEGDPTGSWETPHPIRIKHDNHEVYFGSPVTAHQGITGSLNGNATSSTQTTHIIEPHHLNTNYQTWASTSQNIHTTGEYNELNVDRFFITDGTTPANYGLPVVDNHVMTYSIDNTSTAYIRQLAFDIRSNAVYAGGRVNNAWQSWDKLVSKGNVVYGRGNLNSNGTFDANGNVTLEDYGYGSNISVGQVATKPFLRFAYMNAGGASWYDCSIICLIDRGYNGGEWGIFKACIRTNNNSDSSAFSASGAEVQWLVRDGIPTDAIQIGLHSQFQNNYASLFYKITSGYQGARITVLSQNHRGSIGRRWTFQDCSEDNNGNGTECYASIAAYSSALSTIVAGSDVGYANTARYGENVYVSNRRGSGASGRIPLIIDGGISGTDNAYRRPYTIQDDIGFHYRPGTQSSSTGYAYLQLGNNIAYTGGNGTRGLIRLYGNNSYFTDILAPDSNANRTIYLPNRGGRIFTTEMFSLSGTTLTISTS